MKRLNEIFQWISIIGFLMVISSIPYGWTGYQRIACIVMLTGYFLNILFNQQWKVWKWNTDKWMYVVMIALWAMIPLRQLFDATPPTDYYRTQMNCHHWFAFVGMVGIVGSTPKLRLWHVTCTMLATSLVMLVQTLCGIYINSHMVVNLYVNATLLFGFATLSSLPRWWQKGLMILAMILSWGVEFFLPEGRIGMFTSLIIISVCVTYYLYRYSKIAGWLCAVLLVVLSALVMMQRGKMTYYDFVYEPRFVVWDYSVRMAMEKPVCGYGLSTLSEQYVEQAYADSAMCAGFIQPIIYGIPKFAEQGKTMMTHHPHNAFLMYWLSVGIIGVVLLLALFVLAARLPVGDNRLFLWMFLLALFLQCMTEPIGLHLHPQFIALMLFAWEKSVRREVPADNS